MISCLRLVAIVALLAGPTKALAAPTSALPGTYFVDCGTNGSVDVLQTRIATLPSNKENTVVVTGTCVGFLTIDHASRLTVSNLSLDGLIQVYRSQDVQFTDPAVMGDLQVVESDEIRFRRGVVHGSIYVARSRSVAFNTLTSSPHTDATTGQVLEGILCVGQSECTLAGATVQGSGSNSTYGVVVASASRLNLYSGTVSGFGVGVFVWNNATAFLQTYCDNLAIQSNQITGVQVSDSGVAKIESLVTHDASSDCPNNPGVLSITGNGSYGVRAEGGGNAYLSGAQVGGHSIDNLRVENGSLMRVRSSTIGAATTTGRSARVKSRAHLWFDEDVYGPAAGSTLAGPVCVAGNASVDTENSSTLVDLSTTCGSP